MSSKAAKCAAKKEAAAGGGGGGSHGNTDSGKGGGGAGGGGGGRIKNPRGTKGGTPLPLSLKQPAAEAVVAREERGEGTPGGEEGAGGGKKEKEKGNGDRLLHRLFGHLKTLDRTDVATALTSAEQTDSIELTNDVFTTAINGLRKRGGWMDKPVTDILELMEARGMIKDVEELRNAVDPCTLPYFDVDIPGHRVVCVDSAEGLCYAAPLLESAVLIAIDTETRPQFRANMPAYPTALLQLGVRNEQGSEWVFLLDLLMLLPRHSSLLDSVLKEPFSSAKCVILGQGLKDDLRELYYAYPYINSFEQINTVLELQTLHRQAGNVGAHGLKTLAVTYLKCRVKKGEQMSNWAYRPLNVRQLEYAANDVILMLRIHDVCKRKIEEANFNCYNQISWTTTDEDRKPSSSTLAAVGETVGETENNNNDDDDEDDDDDDDNGKSGGDDSSEWSKISATSMLTGVQVVKVLPPKIVCPQCGRGFNKSKSTGPDIHMEQCRGSVPQQKLLEAGGRNWRNMRGGGGAGGGEEAAMRGITTLSSRREQDKGKLAWTGKRSQNGGSSTSSGGGGAGDGKFFGGYFSGVGGGGGRVGQPYQQQKKRKIASDT